MNNHFDIAISLCKQDVSFAKQLFSQLNPSLKIFFYEDKQEEIVTQSGPEIFGNIFKVNSRIVVILSRKEWSESFYTDIEKNAILDRASKEGYAFLFLIPMEPDQIPPWYPSTKIYADPRRFSIEQIAKFIEFKAVEFGGIIQEITLENKYEQFLKRKSQKQAIIELQRTVIAIEAAKKQLDEVRNIFNAKANYLSDTVFDEINYTLFNDYQYSAYFGIGNIFLHCEFLDVQRKIITTQDVEVTFQLLQKNKLINAMMPIETKKYKFLYTNSQVGWAMPEIYKPTRDYERIIFFKGVDGETYDLANPIISNYLVDYWFQKLFDQSTININKYI